MFHGTPSPDSFVQTFEFEGAPGHVSLDKLVLEDLGGGRTRARIHSVHQSVEARDAMVASGMETGLNEGFARLDTLLERSSRPSTDPPNSKEHPMDWKLEVVVLPVSDVDRAKKFYAEQIGFNVDVDQEMGESRIVQMTPRGSGCSVTIGRGLNDADPGSVKGMQLCVGDIEAARAELVARGVDVSPIRHVGPEGWADGNGGEWNAFIFFDDPDGNSWAVQESPTLRAELEARDRRRDLLPSASPHNPPLPPRSGTAGSGHPFRGRHSRGATPVIGGILGRMTTPWFGLHLPNYTFPDRSPAQVFDATVEQAKAAEAAGFSLVTVMDHLNQIPGIGQQDEPMLEGWSVLAALARETKTVRLGTLVTGVTYRNPALLAKTVTTLDVISGGRAIFGLGAAWFEAEHDAFGYEFPPIRERMDRLDEALTIAKAMFTQERLDLRRPVTTRSTDVINVPQAGPAGRAEDPRRRWRGAADAQDRGQARRHDALVPARSRDAPAQEGRPRQALRGHRPRPGDDRAHDGDARRAHPERRRARVAHGQDPRGAAAVRHRRRDPGVR